ncbi:L-aspartate oxidase [Aliarcobacter trophiarum LMG 25534]|uniref:L-aspartate oxidase n=1 Tax=Aliarcobacter trophiarum LMG 25534 TaxID=1032241 RepID=A0AAD0QIT4_9BACT|nr:L-aspartate oxidase [Aliarcobacter trophiarum]AXK48774.1 L-aspartate oxidase [Aliarcobacter trophiarum LMG 25534]RXI25044.1 L-aspartate oxidase [Aliarcobacter trophiarum]RXJ92097.1 L-aspartate oxidase [Aliarcobacter trophiarum LMG 25534]
MIYDYIIIGAGIAGLNAARLIPKSKRVLILCKMSTWNSNTFWAQGGIASAVDKSDIPTHIKDTLEAGANYNDLDAVKLLSNESISAIKEIIEAGMIFDKNIDGDLAYTKEAAHSRNRILHAQGDATGREIHIFLLEHCPHEVVTQAVVCDLLIQDNICYGVQYFTNEFEQKVAFAHNTIIASGGVGSLYKYHTNSTANAGEIHGIIAQKGIALKDMEMTQFHPTVLKGTTFARKPLLSEALRGEGAFVVDENGNRFLFDYHPSGELAPRDIVSRAIFDYNKKTGLGIFLSFKNFEKKAFKKRFPNIYENIKDLGYELPFENVPISPAFHYCMGGIDVSLDGLVKGFKNLYAIGEVACNGVHGANRLASNSLLEGLVFSKIAVNKSLEKNFKIDNKSYKQEIKEYIRNKDIDKDIKDDLRKTMWECAGIVRTKEDLQNALLKIEHYLSLDIGRLLNLRLLTAKTILKASIKREKSLGAHFIKEE